MPRDSLYFAVLGSPLGIQSRLARRRDRSAPASRSIPSSAGTQATTTIDCEVPMSDIQRLKGQLYQLMTDAQQGAGSLAGYRQKFGQTSSQVQALIAGSATGTDRDISELLNAAGRSLEQAAESLQIAAHGCRRYADQI
jgi:hypothetical protein